MSYLNPNEPIGTFSRGDMYYVVNNGLNSGDYKLGRPAIIVSNDVCNKTSLYVEIVYLTSQEKRPMPTHVSVMCRCPSTALCESIDTVPKDRLTDFIRSLEDDEMRRIDQALIASLGLSRHNEVAPKPVGASAVSSVEVELEVYKRLYSELLAKVTAGA